MTLPLAYPDVEQVIGDLLSSLGITVTWLPPDPEPGTIWVQRIGGGPDPWDLTDYAQVRVATIAETRNASMDMSKECERMILGHRKREVNRPGTLSHGVLIDLAELSVGPQVEPDLDPDERRVIKNYDIGLRRQYHLVG